MNTLPIKINKGRGPAIVLLHGLGNNYQSWTHVLDNFDYGKNTIVALDLLGFGDAQKPTTDYTLNDHAQAVIETIDALRLSSVAIAGHSMGCVIAAEVARQRPDLVNGLVLLGPPLYRKIPTGRWYERLFKREGAYFSIFKSIQRNPDLTIGAANAADTLIPFLKGMEITEETWIPFKKSLSNTLMQTQSYKTIISLRIPTTLVYGYLDVFVSKEIMKSAARKNKQFVTYETMLGPHEITPLQGKKIAEMIQK